MTRIVPLLTLALCLALAACGGGSSATTEATATPTATSTSEPTEEPTPEPTEAATAPPTDGGGSGSVITGSLDEVLPDEVAGIARTELPAEFQAMLRSAMAGQGGVDPEELDFTYALYGEEGELLVIGMRQPEGLPQANITQMARMFAAMAPQGPSGQQLDAQAVDVGGKQVLRMTTEGEEGVVFVYQAGDAFFTVVAQAEDIAEELISQLP